MIRDALQPEVQDLLNSTDKECRSIAYDLLSGCDTIEKALVSWAEFQPTVQIYKEQEQVARIDQKRKALNTTLDLTLTSMVGTLELKIKQANQDIWIKLHPQLHSLVDRELGVFYDEQARHLISMLQGQQVLDRIQQATAADNFDLAAALLDYAMIKTNPDVTMNALLQARDELYIKAGVTVTQGRLEALTAMLHRVQAIAFRFTKSGYVVLKNPSQLTEAEYEQVIESSTGNQ